MIVEFVGLSCVGKSTLIAEVARLLAREGSPIICHNAAEMRRCDGPSVTRRQATVELMRGMALSPELAVAACLHDESTALRRHLRAVGYMRRLRVGRGIHLIDEGPFKTLPLPGEFSLRQRGRLVQNSRGSDLVVHVVCDTQVRVERVKQTGRSHGLGLTTAELLEREGVSSRRLARLVGANPAAVLEVDPTADSDAGHRVARWIRAASEHAAAGSRDDVR